MAKTMGESAFNTSNAESRIKVAVRIRPLLDTEVQQGHQTTQLRANEQTHQISITKSDG
jgi:hypothetical protein